jgi:hypothetical protein
LVTLHLDFILEVNLEKLFVGVFSLQNSAFVNVDTGFVFATTYLEAKQKAKELMRQKYSDMITPHLQQLIEVDDQLITKAYNNLPSTNNN